MNGLVERPVLDFFTYPPVGDDDWRYGFATARVRTLETYMPARSVFLDMANAPNFDEAAEHLASTEYSLGQDMRGLDQVERVLTARRAEARKLFSELMIDEPIAELFRTRADFANLRLGIRRALLGKGLGKDYSQEGTVAAEEFIEIVEQQNYDRLPGFLAEAAEQAVLGFYQSKDVRQIDYAIDAAQWRFYLCQATKLKNIFLQGLFRIQIDLTNIRTMLRMKFGQQGQEFNRVEVFGDGGYVEIDRLWYGLETGYDGLAQLFAATPYCRIVEVGTNYLVSSKSFLKLEQQCDEYLAGFLKTTLNITAGAQPVIAYLLAKENEIRTVRLILTCKKNGLDKRLILDRLGEQSS